MGFILTFDKNCTKMSSRPILSRPRTRIYDANYNIGQNYYKPTIDRLDRKYSGRPITPPRSSPSIAQDIIDRHERVFQEDDLPSIRRRAEKLIQEPSIFDSRGGRISASALEDSFDEEISSAVQRIRANKKVPVIDDIDMESTVGNLTSRRIKERADKLLDSVGVKEEVAVSPRRAFDEDVTIKRRSVRISQEESIDANDLGSKWTSLSSDRGAIEEESMAKQRALATKARLNEIEEEMNALADKQAARERRAARLKALVAETAQQNEEDDAAVQSVRVTARKEKRTVEF
ncbi:hypothetical protein Trydic_g16443 [Trypoxylus dichotomus]